MDIALATPSAAELTEVVGALRAWQRDDGPFQLHPGDLGWYWRFGAEATAAAVRTWSRDRQLVAIGMLDGPTLLRMAFAPDAETDDELATHLAADLTQPPRGVLPAGEAYVEAPTHAHLQQLLAEQGWTTGEAWTPLQRDLTEPVPCRPLRVEVVGPAQADARSTVQRAAFAHSSFTIERWRDMASGLPYADGRCLIGYDEKGSAVAAVTVWSAGPGRPGLVEPMGVHREHRGQGHGVAITMAGAAALRDMGASQALVCTPTANTAAVATYTGAGFVPGAPTHDRCRSPAT